MSPTIRPRVVVDEEYVEQTSYTLDLDLPTTGKLSTLWLICKARTSDTPTANEPFMKYLISSISVNQAGQDALNAARPQAFEASYYYKTGKFPKLGSKKFTDDVADIEEVIPIMFGQKVVDPDYYIDLSKLSDPKLSVTYDLATTGLQAGTLWDTAYYPRFTILADLFEEEALPPAKGYYSLRQYEQYNPSDSQEKKIELKGKRPIKRFLLERTTENEDYEWYHNLDRLKIWGQNEAWVPFTMKARHWMNLIREKFGLCEAIGQLYYSYDDKFTDTIIADKVSLSAAQVDSTSYVSTFHGGSGEKSVLSHILISDGSHGAHNLLPIFFRYVGTLPWSIGVLDFEKMMGMEHLDPTEKAPVYLELDHTSNADTYADSVRVNIEDLAQQ